MTYALGRGLESYDLPAVRAIMRDAEKQNDTIPALIDAIVRSPQFQMRRNRRIMIITKKALHRRTFLRGAGTAMALPLLDSMVPAMAATVRRRPSPPFAWGSCYVPNGIIQKDWLPTADGTGFEFMPTHEAAGAVTATNFVVLSNLAQLNGRALGDGARRSCARRRHLAHRRSPEEDRRRGHPRRYFGRSDRREVTGEKTQFGSLEIGLEEPYLAGGCDSGYSCAYTNTISWRGPTTPNPMEISPRGLFERLFGDGESTDPAARMKRMKQDRTHSRLSCAATCPA